MKAGRPVVLGSQPHPDAKRVLCRRAKELRCRWAWPAGASSWQWHLHSGAMEHGCCCIPGPALPLAVRCLGTSWRSGGDECLAVVQDI